MIEDAEAAVPAQAFEDAPAQTQAAPRVPRVGDWGLYRLTATDAQQISQRRQDAFRNQAQIVSSQMGYVAHTGNHANEGDVYPMLIVRVWGDQPGSSVNGQVFLDGNDTLWVASVAQGEHARQYVLR